LIGAVPLADHPQELLAGQRVALPAGEQFLGASPVGDPERQQSSIAIVLQCCEERVESGVGDPARGSLRDGRPVAALPLVTKLLVRIVVSVCPAVAPGAIQRKRVQDRPGSFGEVEVVERSRCALELFARTSVRVTTFP
jgi:hypothetical protein